MPIADQNVAYQILSYLFAIVADTDDEATSLIREFYKSSVEPIERILQPGTLLVEKGDIVTPEIAEILSPRLFRKAFSWMQAAMLLFMVFLWSFCTDIPNCRSGKKPPKVKMLYFASLLVLVG